MSTHDAEAIREGLLNRRRESTDPLAMMLWFSDARRRYGRRRFRLYARAFYRLGGVS